MVRRTWYLAACGLTFAFLWNVAASGSVHAAQAQPPAPLPAATSSRAILDKYCVTCHNQKLKTADLMLDTLDVGNVAERAETWERVVRKLRSGMMPPPGRPRPDASTANGLKAWAESELDHAAASHPDPGRTETFHRINRTEYKNIIRDLLALDVDVTTLLPADDTSYGFDNIAGVLKVNQTGMERNLAAARKISRLAVGSSAPAPGTETFAISPQLPQYEHVEGLPFGTRGGALLRYNFPQDGTYEFLTTLMCVNTRGGDENCADGSTGFPEAQEMVVLLDGDLVHEYKFESEPRHDRYAGNTGTVDGTSTFADTQRLQFRLKVKAGPHDLGVTFLKLPSVETVQRAFRQTFNKPQSYRGVDRAMQITVPYLSKVTIGGPFEPAGVADTPSRRAIFVCRPASAAEESGCAKTILTRLTRRAYRRPVTDADVHPLLDIYTGARSDGESFDGAIEDALRALLVRPQFWFRVERDPVSTASNTVYALSDVELASRLSFFIWSSMPDDELLDIAARGQLKEPAVLDRQIRRMMADPKAQSLTSNFAEEWLELRRLATVTPNESDFPNFEESLRSAFQQETELFIDSIIRENRSAVELLTADYTFLNERLARHYDIRNVEGSHFRRVTLPADSPHRGLLGQGSVLAVTSHPTRTSPVKRGKWILDNILGTSPPPPPPNVPVLKEKQNLEKVASMRERMSEHRSNPYCAGCHSTIDPLGFALENFDSVGRFRTVDETYMPIDASGSLPDGTKFDGIVGLRNALTSRPDLFVTTLTEKLMTYALGRGVEYYDMPAIRKIVHDSARSNYRFSSIILGIANSVPFKMRKVDARQQLSAANQ